ncbi:type II toxin-antitoxin system PemK/MazF family toxin [Escherichia coli]|uniref:type II toxin-antitoxin system PemK/MazF family toxin n=1 Tax=Escherichia coli TaxID=562 RepID=UPI000FB58101|nr:type II toxin-antitoxin system PemK/MazF family toxin [Escherichia coli]EED1399097.1 type II toxin-antitoxin system PemK/MazF family toxin [Escherichia coli]EET7762923.1 type II toxin-antitoxin system PemK/MazF family toxin [Escherichia coli]EFI8018924.1 type II toxin-antitoxin system PemK/MazF family toxin [Escherichia coli]EFN7330739.1 type II toxin-antitoxin system PemK/MazF family toxin [Escherichia coli]EIA0494724.1 type II toxin-antitoxin system PemK/MazF family toxin [Escherichia col
MPISYHPKPGQLMLCDFSQGFKEPEMVKSSRPVIILSGNIAGRANLATVVACSTVEPDVIRNYHYKLPAHSMPKTKHFMGRNTWVKGDMVYTVAFHRLDAVCIGRDDRGKRMYYTARLGREQMGEIYRCVLHGMGMSFLCQYIV